LQRRRAGGAEPAERGIVDDDGRSPEGVREGSADLVVVGRDGDLTAVPRRGGDGQLLLVVRLVVLDVHAFRLPGRSASSRA
jgi:hypothetical protein